MAVIAEATREHRTQAIALGKARNAVLQDRVFIWLTLASAVLVVVLLLGVMVSLLIGAWPALSTFGPAFLWTERWSPVKEIFGALAPIYGTIVTSLIAMVIGIPGELRHRHLPHRALPAAAAPPDRHRHRAARRHPLDHLRPLGLLLPRAVPADHGPALAHQLDRQACRSSACCSAARPTASAC